MTYCTATRHPLCGMMRVHGTKRACVLRFAASPLIRTRLSCFAQRRELVHLVEMFTFLAGVKSWIGDLGRLRPVKVSFAATARTTWRPTCHRQYQVAARRRAHRGSSSRCVPSILGSWSGSGRRAPMPCSPSRVKQLASVELRQLRPSRGAQAADLRTAASARHVRVARER